MKFLLKLLAAGASLLAMTVHASADPFSIGVIISSAFLSTTGVALAISPTLIGSLAIGALTIGGQILSSVFAKPDSVPPQEYKSTFETGDSSEVNALGRVRVGGLKAFGNTNRDDRYRLICHFKGPASATEAHFLGGREVILDPDGAVTSPPYGKRGGSYIKIWSKSGDGSETSWPRLMQQFPDIWTADHRVRGIAQTLVEYNSPGTADPKFLKLYQAGEPAYEAIKRAPPIYDPRTPGQVVDNASTWAWRDNGILAAVHVLRMYPSLKAKPDEFDWPGIAIEATKADALVATKTGTEPRARAWGLFGSESKRGETVQNILRSIGGEIVSGTDGKILVRLIDDVPASEITMPSRHILDLDLKHGPESVERPNLCRVRYYSPERNYEMTAIEMKDIAWARVEVEIDRVGEQPFEVELPFCPSASQAQRIARRLFALARADRGTAVTNFAGLGMWGKSMASLEFADVGDIDGTSVVQLCAIDSPRVKDEDGIVETPFVVWPVLSPFNPATDEAAAPDVIPPLNYVSDVEKPAAPTAAIAVARNFFGTPVTWETRVSIVAENPEATLREYVGGLPDPWLGMTETDTLAWVDGDRRGKKVEIRVRSFDGDDASDFSPSLTVASLAVDNTACPQPSYSLSVAEDPALRDLRVSTTLLRASYVSLTKGSTVTRKDIRPGETVTFANLSSGSYSVRLHSSNGAGGTISTFSFDTSQGN